MGCPAHLLEFDSSVPDPDKRGLPNSVNADLLRRLLRHRHFLLMVENGVVDDLVEPLRDVQRAVSQEIDRLAAFPNVTAFNELRQRQLRELRRSLDDVLQTARGTQLTLARERFQQVAERELEIQNNVLRSVLPNEVHPLMNFGGPDVLRVSAALREPLGGKVWSDRMRRNFSDLTRQMQRDIATSFALGEGMPEAARRLNKTVDHIGIQRSTLIARSEIQRIANSTASKVYRANQSVVKAEQWIATLDDRTCMLCAPLDGQTWRIGDDHPMPVSDTHPACRCYLSPVTRSFKELGIDAPEFGPSTRASMDGQVPATLDYRSWFDQQDEAFQRRVLGQGRFERFKSGDIGIDGFTRRQEILRIDELPESP